MIDAGGEGLDVGGVDSGEHRHAQLVAAELAVGLNIEDAVGAEHGGETLGVYRLGEVDRADDAASLRLDLDERRGQLVRVSPAVEVR